MINKWQSFFLIVLTLPIMGHVVLLPLAIDLAGRDSWISALISFPVGFTFLFVIYRIRLKFPNAPVHIAFKKTFGRFFSLFTISVLIFYFIFLAAVSLAAVVDMIHITFLPATPAWVIVISFLLLAMYGATKSVKGIALIAGVLFFIVMLTGHSITFINFPERDLMDLLPMLEHGWKPVGLGTLLLSNTWIELLFLLTIPFKDIKEKRLLLIWTLGLIANLFMMLSTISGVIMTFGLGQAESFVYPALEIVRIIDINFIDRLDVYALILMTFGSYIRCSLFLKISYTQFKHIIVINSNKWLNITLFITLSIFIGILAYFMGETSLRFESTLTFYAYTFVLYPLPFFLLLVAWIRERKQRSHSLR